MSDELLSAYNRELAYLRELGAEFSRAHPKIAGRLRISADSVEDPHVSRLVESIAFLNARVRKKLDDDFPELTDALLGILAPHLIAPVPSMSIVQFDCNGSLTTSYELPAGMAIETDPGYGPPCQFRTNYAVTTWPVKMRDVALLGAPFQGPSVRRGASAAAVLRIGIETREGQCPIGQLGIDRLRFYLRGQQTRVQDLYKALLDDVICVAVASGPGDQAPLVLDPDCLSPVGFERGEELLPTGRGLHPGQRLLSEYFIFPAKFQFVDLAGLEHPKVGALDERMELYIYLARSSRDLEQEVDDETLALGCTPVVNLFEQRAEPVELVSARSEHHIVPSARAPEAYEVYSVDSVEAVSRDGERRAYLPFYGVRHGEDADAGYWSAGRREAPRAPDERDTSTEVYLTLVDAEQRDATPDGWVLETRVTCLNRNRPGKLPFGGGEPRLGFSEGGGGIESIRALTAFTETLRPERGPGALWKLVSQLSLNHLSISGDEDGGEILRELLRVNDLADTAVSRTAVAAIQAVRSRPSMVRVREGGALGFVRGVEIEVDLDEGRLASSGAYLFAMLLDRVLASYCTVNSLVQLVTTDRSLEEGVRRWPARSGTRALV